MRPQVVAHRGASHEQAEHTLGAYVRALDVGAEGLECDVRLTADGHLVLVHDRSLKRTAQSPGLVSEMTLAQLLLFLSFRVAETRAVVPFFYTGTLWALLVGFVMFSTLPDGLASIGIGLIAASGVLVLLLDGRRKPPAA